MQFKNVPEVAMTKWRSSKTSNIWGAEHWDNYILSGNKKCYTVHLSFVGAEHNKNIIGILFVRLQVRDHFPRVSYKESNDLYSLVLQTSRLRTLQTTRSLKTETKCCKIQILRCCWLKKRWWWRNFRCISVTTQTNVGIVTPFKHCVGSTKFFKMHTALFLIFTLVTLEGAFLPLQSHSNEQTAVHVWADSGSGVLLETLSAC